MGDNCGGCTTTDGDCVDSMDRKMILLLAGVGGTLGGYLPIMLGASGLSGWSLLGSFVGGLLGIFAGYKISN